MAAGDRFKQLTKNIEDLRAKMQALKVSVDTYVKDGKSLSEINDLISKNLSNIGEKYLILTKETDGFIAAQQRNIAKNQSQGKSFESLRTQINSISASTEGLRATNESISGVLNKSLSPAIEIQKKAINSVTASIKVENEAYKESVSEIKNLMKGIESLNKVDAAAANKKESLAKQSEDAAKKAGDAQEKAAQKSKGFFQTLFGSFSTQKVASSLGTVLRFVGIYQLLAGVVGSVKTALIESTKRFIEFDRALANLAAIGGTEARNSLGELRQQALEVAGTTRFTAKEIVGLQTELLKLGFTARETINLVKPVSETAQALGEDVSSVATLFGQTINAFGLLAEQAQYVGDVLTSAINNSALSFSTFSTAIQYIGPLAQNAGLSFQQTAQAMGILADNGFRASRIGTGLRGILADLGDTSEGIISKIDRLAKSNLTLSDAVELVGKRNAAQLLVLARNIELLKESGDEYYVAGAATQAAKIQIDSFSGAVSILSSSWDSFLTRVGEWIAKSPFFTSTLKGLVAILDADAGAAINATDAFNTLKKSQDTFAKVGIKGLDFEGAFKLIVKGARDGTEAFDEFKQMVLDYYSKAITAASNDLLLQRQIMGERSKAYEQIDEGRTAIIAMGDAEKKAYSDSVILQEGRKKATDKYSDAVQRLIDLQEKASPISIEGVNKLADEIVVRINELTKAIDGYGDANDNARLMAEAEVQGLQEYLLTLGRVISTEKERNAERAAAFEKAQKEEESRLRREIKSREDSIKSLEDSLAIEKKYAEETNDYAKVQEIEIQLLKARSAAYDDLSHEIQKSTIISQEQKNALLDSIAKIEVGEKDIMAAAERIANSFKSAFDGVELEDPELLSDIQRTFIDEQINNFINTFGDKISNEDKAKLSELLALSIFGDGGKSPFEDKGNKLGEALKKKLKQIAGEAVAAAGDIIDEFNDLAFENLKRQLEAEKALIQSRSEFEQDIVKSQLDSQLISQEEYASRLEQIKKKEIQQQNTVEKELFEADKKRDRQQADSDFAEAVAMAFINEIRAGKEFTTSLIFAALTAGIATAKYSAQVSSINKRKFYPTKFAEGGVVSGPSHHQGGVPFTVQGVGGYEMEGGEYIINKRSASRYKTLLDQINGSEKKSIYKFADGGIVKPSESLSKQLELLGAIADATTGTAINTGRPVRAFVSSSDLQTDTTARRIKDRNRNI